MRIASAKLWSYRLALNKPMPTTGADSHHRDGLIVELKSPDGLTGLGEIAPLPHYSTENLREAQTEIQAVLWHLNGYDVPPNLEELSGGFENWLGKTARLPSVRFGIESAVLNLMAAGRGVPVAAIMADKPSRQLILNGLLAGVPDEMVARAGELLGQGYRALKLKVGRLDLETEIALVRKIRAVVGDKIALRLDANCRFSVDDATRFGQEIAACHVEYLEEPVASLPELKQLLTGRSFPLPVALDESLASMVPSDLTEWSQIQTIVIKPTRLGLERAMMFARIAIARGGKAVVSSTFESGVGVLALINFAAALGNPDVPVGLDTLGWFEQDLLVPPLIFGPGLIELNDLPTAITIDSINPDLIDEVTRD